RACALRFRERVPGPASGWRSGSASASWAWRGSPWVPSREFSDDTKTGAEETRPAGALLSAAAYPRLHGQQNAASPQTRGGLDRRAVEADLGGVGVARPGVGLEVDHRPAALVPEGEVDHSFQQRPVRQSMQHRLLAPALAAASRCLEQRMPE